MSAFDAAHAIFRRIVPTIPISRFPRPQQCRHDKFSIHDYISHRLLIEFLIWLVAHNADMHFRIAMILLMRAAGERSRAVAIEGAFMTMHGYHTQLRFLSLEATLCASPLFIESAHERRLSYGKVTRHDDVMTAARDN